MADWFRETALSGSLALAIPVALVAGLVSFFSPCVIPLLPGYLSYATGLSGADLANGVAGTRRGRMFLGSVLFVLGFATVFVILGTLSGAVGAWLVEWERQLAIVLGLLAIVLGLAFAGWIPFLNREWRVHKVPAVGLAAAPLLGFLFGLGWLPCTGPTLAVISTLALTEGTAGRGALLLGIYALGLGVPFFLAGIAIGPFLTFFQSFKKHLHTVERVMGGILVVTGVLFITGNFTRISFWFLETFPALANFG